MTAFPPASLKDALAGRYTLERELGVGGMATVYLARDVRHEREVAIKVLHPDLGAALGGERFLVEIKTTAKLQHPHILPLLDSGSAEGLLFYVMPYVAGETLRDRLTRERLLPIADAVRLAREIASALDYAHRQGVIHRDIKPENILLHDGSALVADFGIALAVQTAGGARMTQTGLSLGTPQYMSPEQAMGEKTLDARSDLYALGAVTYEMLTGEPPFTGASVQAVVARILAEKPTPIATLRDTVPAPVAAAVMTALAKLPADRFADARQFAEALGEVPSTVGTGTVALATRPVAGPWNRLSLGLALTTGALAVALGAVLLTRRPEDAAPSSPIRFSLTADDSLQIESRFTRSFAISPDGRTIVFRASRTNEAPRLWVRMLDDPQARPIDGTEGGANPVFSPDGAWVAFVVNNFELKKVRITGGAVTPLVKSQSRTAALAWGDDDQLYFEQIGPSGGIHRVSANGGSAVLAVPLDTASGEISQRRPVYLRGAGTIVYGGTRDVGATSLVLFRLQDGRRQPLDIPGIGALAFVDDRLIYATADGAIMAVALDVRGLRASGNPVSLEPRTASSSTGTAVAISEGGTLVYRPSGDAELSGMALVDTSGVIRRIRGRFAQAPVRLTPDGRRAALGVRATGAPGDAGALRDLWVVDLTTEIASRLRTRGESTLLSWTNDGRGLIVPRTVGEQSEWWLVPADGSAESRLLEVAGQAQGAPSVASDGRSLVSSVRLGKSGLYALLRLWRDGSGRIDTLFTEERSGFAPASPRLSPDGHLLAFQDASTSEVYVQPMNGQGALLVGEVPSFRRPVVWGPDSKRLYYLTAGLQVIELETTPALRVVRRSEKPGFPVAAQYDLAPDGRTFLMFDPVEETGAIYVVVGWADEARRVWRGDRAR